MSEADLADRLAQVLAQGDEAAIAAVYGEIASFNHKRGDVDSACFFWTQSLVYAMVAGLADDEAELRQALVAQGRL